MRYFLLDTRFVACQTAQQLKSIRLDFMEPKEITKTEYESNTNGLSPKITPYGVTGNIKLWAKP